MCTFVANAIVGRCFLMWLMDNADAGSCKPLAGGEAPKRLELSRIFDCYDPKLEGITVDLSGGLQGEFLPLDPAENGFDERNCAVLQCNRAANGHHDLRFAAWRAGERSVVCCRLQSGVPQSASELARQCYTRPLKRKERTAKDEVDLLLAINDGESLTEHITNEPVLSRRCVHINSNRFCDHRSLFVEDPSLFESQR